MKKILNYSEAVLSIEEVAMQWLSLKDKENFKIVKSNNKNFEYPLKVINPETENIRSYKSSFATPLMSNNIENMLPMEKELHLNYVSTWCKGTKEEVLNLIDNYYNNGSLEGIVFQSGGFSGFDFAMKKDDFAKINNYPMNWYYYWTLKDGISRYVPVDCISFAICKLEEGELFDINSILNLL